MTEDTHHCEYCGRREATEDEYWAAYEDVMAQWEACEQIPGALCWSNVTGHFDGPYNKQYQLGYQDCVLAARLRVIESQWPTGSLLDVYSKEVGSLLEFLATARNIVNRVMTNKVVMAALRLQTDRSLAKTMKDFVASTEFITKNYTGS